MLIWARFVAQRGQLPPQAHLDIAGDKGMADAGGVVLPRCACANLEMLVLSINRMFCSHRG